MLGASHGPEKDISRFYCDSTPFALCDNPPPPINFIFFVLFPPAYLLLLSKPILLVCLGNYYHKRTKTCLFFY